MLTILTTPKRFTGIFDVIQTNAITAWTLLEPRPEIILFGNEDGTAEISDRLRLQHVPDVATSPEGTPLLSDMFLQGQALATNEVVCWSNADIIFTNRLLTAAAMIRARRQATYMVGRRIDLDVDAPLDFARNWEDRLVGTAMLKGERKPANWIDYFMFNRGLFSELPPFVIGRPGYDQWLIWKAADLGADIVDATEYVDAIHQRHDYSHIGNRTIAFTGLEAQHNAAIVDDWHHYHSTDYARLKVDSEGRLVPTPALRTHLARLRTRAGHALRFARPFRRRLLGERATRRRGG